MKRPGSNNWNVLRRRERVSELAVQGFSPVRIADVLGVSRRTIDRDIKYLQETKAEEARNAENARKQAIDQKMREYNEFFRLYCKKPRRYPVKYQEVEEVDGRKVIVEKVTMVEENDRRRKLKLLKTLQSIDNDINRLNGLAS